MLAWFWLTPIVYAWQLPADKLSESGLSTSLTLLNPIVPIVISLQRGIWGTDRFVGTDGRSEEHTSELQSLMRISYAVFCLKKKKKTRITKERNTIHSRSTPTPTD